MKDPQDKNRSGTASGRAADEGYDEDASPLNCRNLATQGGGVDLERLRAAIDRLDDSTVAINESGYAHGWVAGVRYAIFEIRRYMK